MQAYKTSRYNLLIPIAEVNEYLLCNTHHGGLVALSAQDGKLLEQLAAKQSFFLDAYSDKQDILQELIEKRYIVDSALDEVDMFTDNYRKYKEWIQRNETGHIGLTTVASSGCNMACSYCYEINKPIITVSDEVINSIVPFLESMIAASPAIPWKTIHNTWYGGEPLLGKNMIGKLTPALTEYAHRHNMVYTASIITNGVLLTKETWQFLKDHHVTHVQVTVDGPKQTHNRHRPLKNPKATNYETILENLANKPEEISVTVRVNVDYEVADNIEILFDDLRTKGIWPQRYKEFTMDFAWLRTYEEANEANTSLRIPDYEWDNVKFELKKKKIDYYNRWAKQYGLKPGKLSFELKKPSYQDCLSATSPFVLVIDADGYISKCWESVHQENKRIQHISEKFDITKYSRALAFNRFDLLPDCQDCKYLPFCTNAQCTQNCGICYKKTQSLEKRLKAQYIYYQTYPDLMVFYK